MDFTRELARLGKLTVKQLKARFLEVFGEETKTNNKQWLIKRIAWRIQALEEGDLSERARKRAEEVANDADLRVIPPTVKPVEEAEERTIIKPQPTPSDDRLPPPGTILTRQYKGEQLEVLILPNGFEHEGRVYRSLSAVAKAITGSHCNGFAFFNLKRKDHQ